MLGGRGRWRDEEKGKGKLHKGRRADVEEGGESSECRQHARVSAYAGGVVWWLF